MIGPKDRQMDRYCTCYIPSFNGIMQSIVMNHATISLHMKNISCYREIYVNQWNPLIQTAAIIMTTIYHDITCSSAVTEAEQKSELALKKDTHMLTSRSSYGMSVVRILKKIDSLKMAPVHPGNVPIWWDCWASIGPMFMALLNVGKLLALYGLFTNTVCYSYKF